MRTNIRTDGRKIKADRVKIVYTAGFILLLGSCTTYTIPENSFKQQFAGIDSTKLVRVKVLGPVGEIYEYDANPIKTIECMDRNGNVYRLEKKPSIEIRFTYGEKNKRTILYFDRIYVSDSMVVGVKSRFISSLKTIIPLKDITKIEVQDGRKNFQYITH